MDSQACIQAISSTAKLARVVRKIYDNFVRQPGSRGAKEKTRKVFDAENGKIGSGEALPERSDRERDEMAYGVWGRQPPA